MSGNEEKHVERHMSLKVCILRQEQFIQKFVVGIFFLLLLLCVRENVTASIFGATCTYMLLYIIYATKDNLLKLAIATSSVLLLAVFLVHNADHQYGVLQFNSSLYPVNIQDYLSLLLAIIFGYFATEKIGTSFLFFLEVFTCTLSLLIFSHIFSWNSASNLPVFLNSNWSGTLIISVMPLTINVAMRLGISFLESGFLAKYNWLNLALFLVLLSITTTNFYLLMRTGSRSAGLAFLVSFAVLFFVRILSIAKNSGSLRKFVKFRYIAPSLVGITVSFIFFAKDTTFVSKITNLYDQSNLLRVRIFECYYDLFLENFLLGVGIGNSASICETYLSSAFGYENKLGFVNHAHNFVLQIAADHGVFGLVVVIFSLVAYFWLYAKCWASTIKECTEKNVTIFAIYLTIFAIGFASLLQSSVYHVPFLPIWLGLMVGTAIAATHSKLKRSPQ